MNILENKNLIIESKCNGGELTRIYSKHLNKELLWNGDPKHWGRHSPILFPIVGRLNNNTTYIENDFYNMNQHGFARDMDFNVVDTTNDSISYQLVANSLTKKLYPYDFTLTIKYTLLENGVKVDWTVSNKENKEIYFSIGAHPAFNIDVLDFTNYYLEFNTKDNVEKITLDGPYFDKIDSVKNLNTLNISPECFENDAIIYTNINNINLKNKDSNYYLSLDIKDFPLVGIWTPYYKDTKSTAPFLCIEPWFGIADGVNSDGIFKNKKYINKLNPLESFKTCYTINIEKE